MDYIDKFYNRENFKILNKLTIVIPTHNRNNYLSRCLWYHAHFPYAEIIVADSSLKKKREINQKTINNIQRQFNIKINHLEYDIDLDEDGNNYYWKWGDGIEHVNTEYSVICIDKVFLEPFNVKKSLEFLDNNASYVSCRGRECSLKERKYNKYNKYHISMQNNVTLSNDLNVIDNIIHLLSLDKPWDNAQLFSITRSNVHRNLYRTLLRNNIVDIRTAEIVLSFFGNIHGKTKIFENPYFLKDLRNISKLTINKRNNLSESADSRYPNITKLLNNHPSYLINFKESLIKEGERHGYKISDNQTKKINEINLQNFDSTTSQEREFVQKHELLYNIYNEFVPQIIIRIIVNKLLLANQNRIPIPPTPINKKIFNPAIFTIQKALNGDKNDDPIKIE